MKTKNAIVCVHCGVSPKDQHSLRESAICDYMRTNNLTATNNASALDALKRGEKL